MKKNLLILLSILMMPMFLASQDEAEAPKGIQWMGENEEANAMVTHGIWHMFNVQREKALAFFEGAAFEDPTLFAPHVAIAQLSWGDKRVFCSIAFLIFAF